jgi:Tfp pilus assembly protein PilV
MNFLRNLPVKMRLTMLVALLALIGIAVGLLGISGMRGADRGR